MEIRNIERFKPIRYEQTDRTQDFERLMHEGKKDINPIDIYYNDSRTGETAPQYEAEQVFSEYERARLKARAEEHRK